ncbi:MAG: 2,3-bisphosphoglycerate-independent phosphoglycerate mutase [Bacilli bacterium]|nr:2,3-bisphosphoglycerate-independent phosphoglycerate mutase [Bacilli bacterium]
MMKKVLLCIMDGIGLCKDKKYNALYNANTPVLDKLWDSYPHSTLEASGELVGLPRGQMGNSEVGHTNIGAGRIVYQSLELINSKIRDKYFFSNEEFLSVINHVKVNNSKIHLIGLLSDGGVHSHINHLFALLELMKKEKVCDVYIHIFTDGRDVSPTSGIKYIEVLEKKMKSLGVGKIASISGRYYGMDRDNRWDRVEKSYRVMTEQSDIKNVIQVWKDSHKNNITDEFIEPFATCRDGLITDNDGIIFFNFRPDRLRELGSVFTNRDYECFDRNFIENLKVVTMMPVSDTVLCPSAFRLQKLDNTLGEYIASLGLSQLRIAETEKYAHVTYFFDGGEDKIFDGEKRILVPSPKVATYDIAPEMSAYMITASLVKEITTNHEDLVILNFANGDMVGHTGDYGASIKAVETVDKCLGKILDNISLDEYTLIVTADHGNVEVMKNRDGSINTSHTTNKVPFIVTNKRLKLKDGKLSDIAPTILYLMGQEIPKEMTGNVLIKNRKVSK